MKTQEKKIKSGEKSTDENFTDTYFKWYKNQNEHTKQIIFKLFRQGPLYISNSRCKVSAT